GAHRQPVSDVPAAPALLPACLQQLLVVCGHARIDHEPGAGVTRKRLAGPDRNHDVAVRAQALDHAVSEAALVHEIEPPAAGVPADATLHMLGGDSGTPPRATNTTT